MPLRPPVGRHRDQRNTQKGDILNEVSMGTFLTRLDIGQFSAGAGARNVVCSHQERATNLRHRIFTAFALLVLPFAAIAAEVPQIGQPAPEFSLPSQEGGPVSLKDFRGQWVVLYFYPKDMTPGCTIEAHNFQRDLAKYEEQHAVILGVSVDSTGSHKEFCTKESLTFKLLSDTDKKMVDQYGSL